MSFAAARPIQGLLFQNFIAKHEEKCCSRPLSRGLVPNLLERRKSSVVIRTGTRLVRGPVAAFRSGFNRGRQSDFNSVDSDPALDVQGIRSADVRLIDEEQQMVGIVSKAKAIQMARDAALDLVIISGDADPPVVRIMDYSKFKFEQKKKLKEQQKKNRVDLKELKLRYNIGQHDYDVRLRSAHRFLKDGDKIRVFSPLRGREKDYFDDAIDMLERFANDLKEMAKVEKKQFQEITNLHVMLAPKQTAAEKAAVAKSSSNKSIEQPASTKSKEPIVEISAGT